MGSGVEIQDVVEEVLELLRAASPSLELEWSPSAIPVLKQEEPELALRFSPNHYRLPEQF